MTKEHYQEYLDRAEDLGMQILDLVAEMRADPPPFEAENTPKMAVFGQKGA